MGTTDVNKTMPLREDDGIDQIKKSFKSLKKNLLNGHKGYWLFLSIKFNGDHLSEQMSINLLDLLKKDSEKGITDEERGNVNSGMFDISWHTKRNNSSQELSISLDLSGSTIETLAQISSFLGGIEKLILVDCELEDHHLLEITQDDTASNIIELDLSYNNELTCDGFQMLPKILKCGQVKSLNLTGCDVTEKELRAFWNFIPEKLRISRLDLSCNENLDFDGISELCQLVHKLDTKSLHLSGCELDKDKLGALEMSLQRKNLSYLDISDNKKIGYGSKTVGEIVRKCRIKELDMSECTSNSTQLGLLLEGMKNFQLQNLNLSESTKIVGAESEKLFHQICKHVEKKLTLRFKKIDPKLKKDLVESFPHLTFSW